MSKKMISISTVVLLVVVLAACGTPSPTATSTMIPETTPSGTAGMDLTATMDPTDAMTAEATGTPSAAASLTVTDQSVVDGTVTIDEVVSNGPGWVVIHADNAGEPGEIVGYAAVVDGTNTSVVVELDETVDLTETLHAMLHQDTGVEGTFEPDTDSPVMVDGQPVSASFMLEDFEDSPMG